jgi:hypothetical protein
MMISKGLVGHNALHFAQQLRGMMRHPIRNVVVTGLVAGLLATTSNWIALAAGRCDGGSRAGDVCICELAELHPTQAAVGMAEVQIRAEKLRKEMQSRSEQEFLAHLRKHDRVEPVVVGPSGVLYITDHHHLARALYELGQTTTYCKVLDNLSTSNLDAFWKHLKDNNEIYLRDRGEVITPSQLPALVKNLHDDPFRSLAGAIREACGISKEESHSPETNYLEFEWADYLRENWSKTGIPIDEINANFDGATKAALQLATRREAIALPGYTGKTSCD